MNNTKEIKVIYKDESKDKIKYEQTLTMLREWEEAANFIEKLFMKHIQLDTIDFVKSTVTYTMVVPIDLCNILNTLHGGSIATLVDGKVNPSVSVDLVINYANAAPAGKPIIIESCAYKIGKNLAFTDTTIRNERGVIAKGSHNKFLSIPQAKILMETINSYLKASRLNAYQTVLVLEALALAIAQSQVGLSSFFQRENGLLMFGILSVLSFFGHCIYYMINSYVDYVSGVDDAETSTDRTLFEVVSIANLLRYIVVSISIMIILTIYLTTLCNGRQETEWMAKMFVIYFISLMFNTCTYTHLKYIALGPISFASYAICTSVIYHCLLTNQLPNQMFYLLLTPILLILVICLVSGYHRDIDEDERAGIITINTLLGKKNSILFIFSLSILFFIISIILALNRENYLLLSVLVSLPETCRTFKRGYYSDSTAHFNLKVMKALRLGCNLYIGSIGIGGGGLFNYL
ncbi:hypothetical protein DFA_01867 [Cavenderia fasciculata]|uniref:Uncharacterized protein n=1 Tax=Cavenderia fasciculata TaxID=261658 RepID=F4PV73_CACFS|nr:uncharacterized protein DFA_01867 [Cavenderia fasciculata]EGG21981.1 hypothetical protein DFA_01867 [Cavenderia fasciculata]|eukprot:XP_004359832.1 hypothetical protein DFA_01867 [Cavenderia fasciculata]